MSANIETDDGAPAGVSARVGIITVGVLMLLSISSYFDRQMIALMVDPLRASFQISDVQIGILHGLAFGIFYAVAGLPMGWLVDRMPRRTVILGGSLTWSAATGATGIASTYSHLLFARFMVGAGEATLSPAAYSIIADHVPKRRLALALSLFSVGGALGSGLCFALGGFLYSHLEKGGPRILPLVGLAQPWQMMFFIVGIFGAFLTLLLFVLPKSANRPRNRATDQPIKDGFLKFLKFNRKYLACHFIGYSMMATIVYSLASWKLAVFLRRFDINIAEIGLYLGVIQVAMGVTGAILSGWLVDRWFNKGQTDAHFRYGMATALAFIVLTPLAFAVIDDPYVMLLFVACIYLIVPYIGPAAAHLQAATPAVFRGRISALFVGTVNLVGLTVGPAGTAFINRLLFGDDKAIGSALAVMCAICGTLAILILGFGLKSARRAIETADSWTPEALGVVTEEGLSSRKALA